MVNRKKFYVEENDCGKRVCFHSHSYVSYKGVMNEIVIQDLQRLKINKIFLLL